MCVLVWYIRWDLSEYDSMLPLTLSKAAAALLDLTNHVTLAALSGYFVDSVSIYFRPQTLIFFSTKLSSLYPVLPIFLLPISKIRWGVS